MATSSLSAVMAIPGIVTAINSCNEILPGMPANQANLKALLDHFAEDEHDDSPIMILKCEGPELLDGGTVTFMTFARREKKQKKRFFRVNIDAPKEWYSATQYPGDPRPNPPFMSVCTIDTKIFDYTEDGLVAALAWAKERAKHLKAGVGFFRRRVFFWRWGCFGAGFFGAGFFGAGVWFVGRLSVHTAPM